MWLQGYILSQTLKGETEAGHTTNSPNFCFIQIVISIFLKELLKINENSKRKLHFISKIKQTRISIFSLFSIFYSPIILQNIAKQSHCGKEEFGSSKVDWCLKTEHAFQDIIFIFCNNGWLWRDLLYLSALEHLRFCYPIQEVTFLSWFKPHPPNHKACWLIRALWS